MAKRIARRRIITGLGLLGMAVTLPSAAGGGLLGQQVAASSADRLLGEIFGNLESARQVGRTYLEQTPAEADREVLAASLQDVLASADGRRDIRSKLRQDFADGNIVAVRGWVLSRTEARLCGLAVLS